MRDFCWRCAFREAKKREHPYAHLPFNNRISVAAKNIQNVLEDQQGGQWVCTVEYDAKAAIPGYGRLVVTRTHQQTGEVTENELFRVEIRTGDCWELGRNHFISSFGMKKKPAFNIYD